MAYIKYKEMLDCSYFVCVLFVFVFSICGACFGVAEGLHAMRSEFWSRMDTAKAPDLGSEFKLLIYQ